jgi:hypothetical protein
MFGLPLTNSHLGRKWGYAESLSMKVMIRKGRQGFRLARLGCTAAVSLCLAPGAAFAAQTTDAQAPPTTAMPWVSDVVKMNNAGISQDVIANYVRNTDARSTLSADDIIYLRDQGISTGLITVMIQHGAVAQSAPTAQTVPMPATPAPAPTYAQYPAEAAPDYSAYQQQPDVNYNYYSYPNYGYSTPYWYWNYYYPYYPVWYYPYRYWYGGRYGFRYGSGYGGGRYFGRSGFHGSFGGGFHAGFHGSSGGFHGGGVHGFSSGHFGGGMGGGGRH